MRVVVIGAGVVGLTTSWFLARQGVQVTLIDRNAHVSRETSFANGGQLSYNFVSPLADPSVLPKLAKWLLKEGSPLRFRPRLDVGQWRWCYAFLKACNTIKVNQTTREMLSLSLRSCQLMDELLAEHPLEFSLKRTGKLVIYRKAQELQAAARSAEYQRSLGSDQRLLSGAQCAELEPALVAIDPSIQGGIYTPTDATGDCRLFCEGLYEALWRMPNVEVVLGQPVQELIRCGANIAAVRLPTGVIEADAFIVAAGLESSRLLNPLGVSLPLYGLRGYSLTAEMPAELASPRLSVTDADRKIVYAPLGRQLRMAAMVDMGDEGTVVAPKRIALLKRQIAEVLPDLDLSNATGWAGLRPATPSSKPIIDRPGTMGNLWLNVGHGALGFTLACASAELVTQHVLQQRPRVNAAAFTLAAA